MSDFLFSYAKNYYSTCESIDGAFSKNKYLENETEWNFICTGILTSAYCSCYKYKDNKRAKNNCIEASGLWVDIDNGISIDDFKKEWIDYKFYLYTSKNHQKQKGNNPPCDRFHVYFPFQENLTFKNDSDRQKHDNRVKGFVESKEYFDNGAKDLARLMSPAPKDAYNYANIGFRYLDLEPYTKQKKQILEPQQQVNSVFGNNYDVNQLTSVLKEINNYKIEYNDYEKLLGWLRNEPQQTKEIASFILSQSTQYNDTQIEIMTKINSFDRPQTETWLFCNVIDFVKRLNPDFKQPINYELVKHNFDTNIDYRTNPIDFVLDVVRFSLKYGTYFLKLKTGWIEVGRKVSDLDSYFKEFRIKNELTNKTELIHRYTIDTIGKQTSFFEPLYNPHKNNSNEVNLFKKIYTKLENKKGLTTQQLNENLEWLYKTMSDLYLSNQPKDVEKFFFDCLAMYVDYKKIPVEMQITGLQGTGKSLLGELLMRLIHDKSVLVAKNSKDVFGNFNSGLFNKTLCIFEEALFSGDKKVINQLKDLVTSRHLTIEAKFKNPIETENHINFISFSNFSLIHEISENSRREFILETNPNYTNVNRDFWIKFKSMIDCDETIEALRSELLNRAKTLKTSDFYIVPTTKQKTEIKKQSNPVISFLCGLYENDFIFDTLNSSFDIKTDRFTLLDLYNSFTMDLNSFEKREYTKQKFSKELLKHFDLGKPKVLKINDRAVRGWESFHNPMLQLNKNFVKNFIPELTNQALESESIPEPKQEIETLATIESIPEPKQEIETLVTESIPDNQTEIKQSIYEPKKIQKYKIDHRKYFEPKQAKRLEGIQSLVKAKQITKELCIDLLYSEKLAKDKAKELTEIEINKTVNDFEKWIILSNDSDSEIPNGL